MYECYCVITIISVKVKPPPTFFHHMRKTSSFMPPKKGQFACSQGGGERALTLHFCKRWTLYSCRGWVLYIAAENMRQGLDGEHQSPVLQNLLLHNKLCPLAAEIEVGRRWMKEVFMSISPGFLSDTIQIFVQFYRRNLWKEGHVWVFEGKKSRIFYAREVYIVSLPSIP